MAFARPTLAEIADRAQQDLLSRLDLVVPILRKAMARVLSRVIAGATHMLHGHLEYLSKQIFADQSERDYLLRWGSLFGVNLEPATFSSGNVGVTGNDGTVIPAAALLRRADGAEYTVEAEATIASGVATVAITAVLAGLDGDCDAGTELSFESPIAGASATAVVGTDGISGGTDEEDIEAYRVRVLERMDSPPHGGNAADYVAWAKEVGGVTRAWCYPLEDGPGTVSVRFVRDNDSSIIPTSNEVLAVQEHIDGVVAHTGLAPVTANVTVKAPTGVAFDVTCRITPNTAATRAAVQAQCIDLLRRIGKPAGTIPLSQLEIAIGTSEGVTDFAIVSPGSDVVYSTGHMPIPGTVTFSP